MKDIVCFLGTMLIVVMVSSMKQQSKVVSKLDTLAIDIKTENPPVTPKLFGTILAIQQQIDTPFIVRYNIEKNSTKTKFILNYTCPYLDIQKQLVKGVEYNHTPFHFHLPVVSIQVKNIGKTPLSIAHLAISVDKSQVDKSPIVILADKTVNQLVFINEGWGKIINPQITISVVDMSTYGAGEILTKVKVNKRSIATFDSLAIIPIDSFIPSKLKRERSVGVFGDLIFNDEDNQKWSLSYRTRIILSANATAPPSNVEAFNLFLEAGKSGYTQKVPIKAQIAIGETKIFNIILATNKTSEFVTKLEFIGSNQEKLNTTSFNATVFMPRSIARLNNLSKK